MFTCLGYFCGRLPLEKHTCLWPLPLLDTCYSQRRRGFPIVPRGDVALQIDQFQEGTASVCIAVLSSAASCLSS